MQIASMNGESRLSGQVTAGMPRNNNHLTARLADNVHLLREAWSLRHAAYASHGYIETKSDGLFKDDYDLQPSAKTFLVYKDSMPAATARVSLYDPASDIAGAHSIPAMDVFSSEIAEALGGLVKHRLPKALEVMRLARHPDYSKDNDLVFALFRIVGYMVFHFDVDAIVSAVRENHIPFYRRMGFERLTEPRAYPKLNFKTCLMMSERRKLEALQQRFSAFRTVSLDGTGYEDFFAGLPVSIYGDAPQATVLPGSMHIPSAFSHHASPMPTAFTGEHGALHPTALAA